MSSVVRNPGSRWWMAAGLLCGLLALPVAGLATGPAAADPGTADPGGADPAAADGNDTGGVPDGAVELETNREAGESRGSVEGELEADGELRRAWVRLHGPATDSGRVDGKLEEIDEDRIPIAVRVRYELDGQPVDPAELRGATGEAGVHIELRNLTTERRTVGEPDGEAVDLDLPLVTETLLELDASWRDVRTDDGRIAPAPDDGSRLEATAALFEPVSSSTTQIELRADVEEASLPHLEVEAVPVTDAHDLLRLLRDRARDTGTSDAVTAFIADSLGEGLAGAAEGAEKLSDGLDQATDGAGRLNEGLQEMQSELEGGVGQLEEGLDRLDAGLEAIEDALARLEAGLGEIEVGIDELGDGLARARSGAATLADEIAEPSEEAVREAWDVLAERYTVGRTDPAYTDALEAVGRLHGLLTGEAPPPVDAGDAGTPGEGQLEGLQGELDDRADQDLTGEDEATGPPGEGPGGGGERPGGDGEGAAALEDYPGLTASLDELAGGIGEAADGAEELGRGVSRVSDGVGELRSGVRRLRAEVAEADGGGLSAGDAEPDEIGDVLDGFEGALEQLASGGQELAGGLGQLEDGGGELVTRLEEELGDTNLELGILEALAERAADSLDDGGAQRVGGHERYLLVFDEGTTNSTPVAALAGLLALAGTLELTRRRIMTG